MVLDLAALHGQVIVERASQPDERRPHEVELGGSERPLGVVLRRGRGVLQDGEELSLVGTGTPVRGLGVCPKPPWAGWRIASASYRLERSMISSVVVNLLVDSWRRLPYRPCEHPVGRSARRLKGRWVAGLLGCWVAGLLSCWA